MPLSDEPRQLQLMSSNMTSRIFFFKAAMAIWAAKMHVFGLGLALAGRNGGPAGCNR